MYTFYKYDMPTPFTFPRRLLLSLFLLLTGGITGLLQAQTLPPGFVDKAYVSGFDRAIGITFDANGTMYTWTKGGEVWMVNNGVKSATPLLDLSAEVGNWRDFGMLCFALDPNFLSNGFFYVLYTVDIYHELNVGSPGYTTDSLDKKQYCTIGRLTRYKAEASTNFTTTDMSSRFVLVGENLSNGFPSTHQSHHVGYISFGQDGTLMATCGDGASYSTVDEGGPIGGGWVPQALSLGIISAQEDIGAYRSQADFSLNGKLIRIDPMTGNGLPSNPHYDNLNPKSVQSRTWANGLRNPCRMALRPGTGSHYASDGDPGIFYIGDVGWGAREELNVSTGPDQNFGWPKYEGITHTPGYNNATWAPTPAAHESPRVDWRTGSARAWIKNTDGTRDTVTINPASTVPGPVFGGNCAIGGVWYTGTDFPEAYQNTYMQADYGGRWIRSFEMDENDNLVEVRDMVTGISGGQGRITCVASSPTEGKLFYVHNGSDVRVIDYSPGNLPPVAEAHADVTYGAGALNVNFRGDRSYDPENAGLSYLWNFDDGTTSTQPNPSHTFPAGVPAGYEVILTVEDNQTEVDRDTIMISANNTPPQIVSTSIDQVHYYTGTLNLPLSAVVNDAEQGPGGLTYAWKTVLHHSNHTHPEPDDNNPVTNTVITPLDC
ncbi:MAG: PQQ-dependent sugar dehydrogenase, partial [Bacteroidota bacterium]